RDGLTFYSAGDEERSPPRSVSFHIWTMQSLSFVTVSFCVSSYSISCGFFIVCIVPFFSLFYRQYSGKRNQRMD
ncbi:hypothetical protein QU846_24135, partial [Escherichia coli]|nr:hypothetical protein [Escherichia coli]MDM8863573.1 hypothetical protein [Escherichia coli]MDM8868503.1 hypothetical protein [Escherichia coli]